MTIYELTGILYTWSGNPMSFYQYIWWYQHTGYYTFIREEGLEF